MKKLMVLLFMLVIVAPVNAYYSEGFGGLGTMSTYGPGSFNNRNVNNFGSNAPFAQQNIDKAMRRQRQIEYEKRYLDSLENTQNINVNVNHNSFPEQIPPPPASYYNNGYNRYYNNNHIPTRGIYYHRGNSFTVPGVRMF